METCHVAHFVVCLEILFIDKGVHYAETDQSIWLGLF